MSRRTGYIITVLILLTLFTLLRVYSPSSDIPSNITPSGSIYTDEGNQCHNSRSKVLFNNWFPDNWKITCYNPFLPYIKLGLFKAFDTGMVQQRIVSYIFAFLSLLFFYLKISSYFSRWYGIAGLLLLGSNFIYLMYNRIGTFETSLVFWMIFTVWALEKYRADEKHMYLFLAGISAFMTFIFKNIAIYFLPAPFIALGIMLVSEGRFRRKQITRPFTFLIMGIGITWLLWFTLFYMPNREWILSAPGKYMSGLMLPSSIRVALNNFINFPWKEQFHKIPVVWITSLFFIPIYFRRLITRRSTITENGWLLLFFANTVFLSIMSYRPTRYFLPVIPAMIFMTICFIKWIQQKEKTPAIRGWLNIPVILFDALWIFTASWVCFIPFSRRFIYFNISAKELIITSLVTALLIKMAPSLSLHNLKKKIALPLSILMIATSVGYSSWQYFSWMNIRTSYIKSCADSLAKLEGTAWIAGLAAPAAVMDTKHKSLFLYPNFVNFDAPFDKYDLSHALLETGASREVKIFHKTWPLKMSHTPIVAVYPLKDYNMHLYDFKAPYIKSYSNGVVTINNPSEKVINSSLKTINLSDMSVTEEEIVIKPGLNTIQAVIPDNSAIGIPTDKLEPTFIYYGGNFGRRTGRVVPYPGNSSLRAVEFRRKYNSPGFIAFGPGVPFAPGRFKAEFHIDFPGIMTRIKPMATIDIVDTGSGRVLASRVVKPRSVEKSGIYTLETVIDKTTSIDFRVRAEGTSGVLFRKMVLNYDLLYFPKKKN